VKRLGQGRTRIFYPHQGEKAMRKAAWLVVVAALVGFGVWGVLQRDGGVAAATAGMTTANSAGPATEAVLVTVYKDARCGCCAEWASHIREAGFRVQVNEGPRLVRERAALGVPVDLMSCHVSTVEDYVLEGHVPADVIRQLLEERPAAAGLAVPRMPEGVPGMPEGRPDRPLYNVIAFERGGGTFVYATR
jgi:hypothetical protein